jgi:enoyl-CoA hydratase/carnithine racemase
MTAQATPTTAPQLLQSVTDGVLTLTLNRPEVLNAITPVPLTKSPMRFATRHRDAPSVRW